MTSVLILDDDDALRALMARFLAAAGADVVGCRELEGAEAVLACRRFDSIIADLNVSERGGLEGMRLIRHVAARSPETRIVAISGMVDERTEAMGLSMGARVVLQKPFEMRDLVLAALGTSDRGSAAGRIDELKPLETILLGGRIRAVLQPICAAVPQAGVHRVHGVEAVARLAQESALYSPSLLFEYAVRKDRVLETDRRCVSAALNEAQFLPDGVRVFLNAHPQSLAHGAFASAMGDMIAQAGLDPRQVVFEVTEQHAIGDADAFAARLEPLRARGFGVALDDYGEGVANLHLLLALKPDFLKLSGHFVRGIEEDAARRAVVAATVGLASRLDVPVIAEGVETEGQLRVVSGLGIPYVQGFCFGQPAPAADLLQNEAVTFEATPACPSRAAG